MARILISGASGLVGSVLLPSLKNNGVEVTRLTRGGRENSAGSGPTIPWDPAQPISAKAVSGFDAVIHLAGESLIGRWTASKKASIRDSRILGTRNLALALANAQERPSVFISASAIGYYGNRGDELLNEESAPGSGFTADVSREWEAATQPALDAGIRTAHLRTGIVLSTAGGALSKMLLPFKMGVGGRIGDGRQWMSWIDIQDMAGAIHHILKSDLLQGAVNLVAPKPVTNEEFTKTLARVLSRPTIFSVPAFAAKLVFGQMAEELLLASQRVEPTRLITSGYPFRFGDLQASLQAMLRK
jgi:uncharacterized protein (TIGR01777 family)